MAEIRPLEISSSNVKGRIDLVDVNSLTVDNGKIMVRFGVRDPRYNTATLAKAQYKLASGDWTNMTINTADGGVDIDAPLSTNPADPEEPWVQYFLHWDAPQDVALAAHEGALVRIQLEDDEGTPDDYRKSAEFAFDFLPVIAEFTLPKIFTKDTTPEFNFNVPPAVHPCNMHFLLQIATDEAMAEMVTEYDSDTDQTGWEIYYRGEWLPMLEPGCPDSSAFESTGKVRFSIPAELDKGDYWFRIVCAVANKREPVEEITQTPEEMIGYPFNY